MKKGSSPENKEYIPSKIEAEQLIRRAVPPLQNLKF